ncbi:MAG: sensor histidine kinase [Aeromonas sp.]
MTNVRPHSLMQLVLMGFLLVLIPLVVGVWHNNQSMAQIGRLTRDEMSSVLRDTRRASLLIMQSTELERALRRFVVLGDPGLLAIYQHDLAVYRELLGEHRVRIEDIDDYNKLEADLRWLAVVNDQATAQQALTQVNFEEFSRANQQLRTVTAERVDNHISRVRSTIAQIMQRFWWVSGLAGALTLSLALLFIFLILRPIRQIEARILSLGSGNAPDLGPVQGPAELVALGERISWLHEQLKALELQKYQFLRHVSHELKTPLAVLREGADLLSEEVAGPLTADQREICALLDENSRRLQTLIERLLDFNRLSQQEQFSLAPVPLAPILAELLAAYRLALESKGIQVHLPEQAITLHAEPYRLRLILDNLFSNAVSYGAAEGHIWIRAGHGAAHDWLEVANLGVPIVAEELARIFEPFEQGSAVRHGLLKGSGMGLSIARESALSLGGALELVADAQADVCFRLTLAQGE